jgi:predicted phosphoribosyltransferase
MFQMMGVFAEFERAMIQERVRASDAGRKLALALRDYKNRQPVVLALPRGGVPTGRKLE